MSPHSSRSILVINPNSSKSMTEALYPIIEPVISSSSVSVQYFTGPPKCPPSINDQETAELSAEVCLPILLPELTEHDGFLVACYSEHPLVHLLRQYTSKPVIGIFEASVTHALLLRGSAGWGIVTTGKTWEDLLSVGVGNFVGEEGGGFEGVESTGLNADQLHHADPTEVKKRIGDAAVRLVGRGDVRAICLGCAGMAGMDRAITEALAPLGKTVNIIDGVKAGVLQLDTLIRCRYENV